MNSNTLYHTNYDRRQCKIGMVHIGYGNFHRAHQAVFIDDIMEKTGDLNWGIAAVNLRASETELFMRSAQASEGYIVKTIAPNGDESYRLVRAHLAFVDAPSDEIKANNILNDKDVKIVTITVTESGYYLDQNSELDLNEQIIKDSLDGIKRETIYDYLAKALAERARGVGTPITIFCCDNMRSNGHILKKAVLKFVDAKGDKDLFDWISKNVSFPSSMVDRITPKTSDLLQDEISANFPDHAVSPVNAETYLQWVIEDDFASDVPDFATAGVQVVSEIEPFEEAKIRILNGGHSGLAYLGVLAGHDTFDQAMRDPSLGKHFGKFESEEVLPGLGNTVPFDTSAYLHEITARFENKGIADNLERICMDGYSKMATYIRPTLEGCLEKGITPEACFESIASWIIFARRFKDGKSPIHYHEPYWDKLAPMIEEGQEEQVATDPNIWGDLPQRFENFVPGVVSAIHRMDKKWQV